METRVRLGNSAITPSRDICWRKLDFAYTPASFMDRRPIQMDGFKLVWMDGVVQTIRLEKVVEIWALQAFVCRQGFWPAVPSGGGFVGKCAKPYGNIALILSRESAFQHCPCWRFIALVGYSCPGFCFYYQHLSMLSRSDYTRIFRGAQGSNFWIAF